jgi:hypothetical protein
MGDIRMCDLACLYGYATSWFIFCERYVQKALASLSMVVCLSVDARIKQQVQSGMSASKDWWDLNVYVSVRLCRNLDKGTAATNKKRELALDGCCRVHDLEMYREVLWSTVIFGGDDAQHRFLLMMEVLVGIRAFPSMRNVKGSTLLFYAGGTERVEEPRREYLGQNVLKHLCVSFPYMLLMNGLPFSTHFLSQSQTAVERFAMQTALELGRCANFRVLLLQYSTDEVVAASGPRSHVRGLLGLSEEASLALVSDLHLRRTSAHGFPSTSHLTPYITKSPIAVLRQNSSLPCLLRASFGIRQDRNSDQPHERSFCAVDYQQQVRQQFVSAYYLRMRRRTRDFRQTCLKESLAKGALAWNTTCQTYLTSSFDASCSHAGGAVSSTYELLLDLLPRCRVETAAPTTRKPSVQKP